MQCRDMHVHGYAILELLPHRNHAQSLYCGGENEQCGKRERFKADSKRGRAGHGAQEVPHGESGTGPVHELGDKPSSTGPRMLRFRIGEY